MCLFAKTDNSGFFTFSKIMFFYYVFIVLAVFFVIFETNQNNQSYPAAV